MAEENETDEGKDKKDGLFTQDELNEIVKKRVAAAKSSTERDVTKATAEALGVSVEEAKAIIASHQAEQEKNKGDLVKAQETADKAAKAAKEAAEELDRIKLDQVKLEALLAKDIKLSAAKKLVPMITTGKPEEVEAEVDTLEKEFPQLFTTAEGDKDEKDDKSKDQQDKSKGGKGDPGKPPPKDPPPDTSAKVRSRLLERHPEVKMRTLTPNKES